MGLNRPELHWTGSNNGPLYGFSKGNMGFATFSLKVLGKLFGIISFEIDSKRIT